MKKINLGLGVIAGRAASVAVSLVLGMLVSVYLVGGWGSSSDERAYERRRRGERDTRGY